MKYIKFNEISKDLIIEEYLVNINSIEHILFKEHKVADIHCQIKIKYGTLWIISFISKKRKFEIPIYYGDKEREELFKRYFQFLKSDENIFDIRKQSDDICDYIVKL
jgi:hypothetical protein